jgi:conjugal transfer ATP-binding protein TraC
MPDPLNTNLANNRQFSPSQGSNPLPSYTPNHQPVFQSSSLKTELQQNNKTVGAFGQYGNNVGKVIDNSALKNLATHAHHPNGQNAGFGANFSDGNTPVFNISSNNPNPNMGQGGNGNNSPHQTQMPLNSSNILDTSTDTFKSFFDKSNTSGIPTQQVNTPTPTNTISQGYNGNQTIQPIDFSQKPVNTIKSVPQNKAKAPQIKTKPNGGGWFGGGSAKKDATKPKADKNTPAYLQTLSPQELKREVVQTEVEIQRTLLENEKNYKKDLTTIRDLISPSSVSISTGQLALGTKLVRSFFVLTYSRIITSGWLGGIINADIPLDLSIFIYPEDSGAVLKDLKGKVGKIQASLQINAEKGAARDPALETAYRDVEALRDAIQQGVEKFFKIGVYVQVYADTQDQLERNSQFIESIFDQQNIILKRAALQMDDGFNSCLPILKDDLYVYSNMNTSPLSACFPFVSSDLSSNSGILYGINRHNSSLVIYDRFDLENANAVVFATTGAGKSYTVKLEILRSLMMGTAVIVIDPEQEYKMLADTVGGAYINFSLNSTNRINPFDLPKPLPGENTGDIIRTATIDLIGLINLMLGKLTPEETSIMERAIMEAYAKRDITADTDFTGKTPPTMSDLVDILNGIVGGDNLAQRLYRYTEGTFAGIFNRQTNINIYNDFVVFNIRDLQDELRPIAMYVLLKYVWNEIRSVLKRRILVCDEAWIMMQYEDSAKFLFGLVKRARKYYLGVTTITQDVSDFLNSPWGKPIVTNAAMKILLKQSPTSIDLVAQTFNLTVGEKQVLLDSEVGQGIFFAGTRHVAIGIIAFPTEHKIITTNPKDLLKMQGLDDTEFSQ